MTGGAVSHLDWVKRLRALGAPSAAARALVLDGAPGADSFDLARAVISTLAPKATVLAHPGPKPPRARFTLISGEPDAWTTEQNGTFDLIVAARAGRGDVAHHAAWMRGVSRLLAPSGVLGIQVDALSGQTNGQGGPLDHLLFPECAAAGDLGEAAALATPLPPASWMLMLDAFGFERMGDSGYGNAPLPEGALRDHGVRLDWLSRSEIEAGPLTILARKGPSNGRV